MHIKPRVDRFIRQFWALRLLFIYFILYGYIPQLRLL